MLTIAVISGKGGVGKTTCAFGTSLALQKRGYRVGFLDLDLDSSSAGDVADLTREKLILQEYIEPVDYHGVKAISLSLFPGKDWVTVPTLLSEENRVEIINQLFKSVNWGELDVLLLDMPPGSGSSLSALLKLHKVNAFLLIASTQRVSELPVRRLVRMALEEQKEATILGIVSNDPYNANGNTAERISQDTGIPVITSIPWDKSIAKAMDEKQPLDSNYFEPIADTIEQLLKPDVTLKQKAMQLRGEGKTYSQIASELKISRGKAYNLGKGVKNAK